MDILAASAWLRYLELFDEPVPFPPNAYQGGYVREMAEQIKQAHGDRYVHPAEAVLACLPETEDAEERLDGVILAGKDLLGEDWAYIHGHVLSEQLDRLPRRPRRVRRAFRRLVLRAQPLRDRHGGARRRGSWKSPATSIPRTAPSGSPRPPSATRRTAWSSARTASTPTFASDIAYHLNKFERGFDKVIDVWGADHHGYIPRVKGALQASGADAKKLDVTLVQFVSLFRDGQKASMSTRSGEYVTCASCARRSATTPAVSSTCCASATRRWISTSTWPNRRATTTRCTTCSTPMPASARCWRSGMAMIDAGRADLAPLQHEREFALCARLAEFPELIQIAARDYAPHALAFYLKDLAGDFHSWYNAERVLVDDPRRARRAWRWRWRRGRC
jgi:arginyl-tRNA synthetase